FFYRDDTLRHFGHEEGRVIASNYSYEYFLKDHLGNTRVTFDESKSIIQDDHYYPFGMRMAGVDTVGTDLPNRYRYNGKELHTELDLGWYDYGARMYDPSIARWNGVDALAEMDNMYSPYTYVRNNPIILIDPDGNFATNPFDSGNPFGDNKEDNFFKTDVERSKENASRTGAKVISSNAGDPDPDPGKKQFPVAEDGVGISQGDPVNITALGATNIYGKYSQVSTRRTYGIPLYIPGESSPLTFWGASYDSYLENRFSPNHYLADAYAIQLNGAFYTGPGSEWAGGFSWVRGGDGYGLIGSAGGGAGWDVGGGLLFSFLYYYGKGRPSYDKGFTGTALNHSVSLLFLSYTYTQDMTKIDGKYEIGRRWRGSSFGVGLYSAPFIGIGGVSTSVTHTGVISNGKLHN
ncbi:MAG: RHS repeat-associated core domain-containing protein, partial [Bacteroidota bacterium]